MIQLSSSYHPVHLAQGPSPASAAHRLARPPILGLRAAVALGCDLEGAMPRHAMAVELVGSSS